MAQNDCRRDAASLPIVHSLRNARLLIDAKKAGKFQVTASCGDEIYGFIRGHARI